MAARMNNPIVTAFLTLAWMFAASLWAAEPAAAQYGPQGGAPGGTWGGAPQEPMPAQPVAPPPPAPAPQGYYGYGPSPAPYPAEEPKRPRGDSDHEEARGNLGVGFLGVASVPLVAGAADATGLYYSPDYSADEALSAPVVGVRYWLNETFGLEGGLGLGFSSGRFEQVNANVEEKADPPTYTAFCLHAGVPIAVAYSDHVVFEAIPAVDAGISMGTIYGSLPEYDWDVSTLQLQVGARVGTEIHFGFLDIPQLALQTSVGLHVAYLSKSAEEATNNTKSSSDFSIGTSFGSGVWDSFTKNLSLIYYIY